MSFSFSAAGTKEETLSSLRKVIDRDNQHDSAEKTTAELLYGMVDAGPAERTSGGQVYDTIYAVSAYGHASNGAPGNTPSLGISLSASDRVREVSAGAAADTAEGSGGE